MAKRSPIAEVNITTDVVIFTVANKQLKILLIRRDEDPFKGRLALPGGFVWQDETTSRAATRLLKTKTSLNNLFLEQLYSFDQPDRDPRGRIVTIAYFALVPGHELKGELTAVEDAKGL